MGDITDLTEQLPHMFFEAMCVGCCHRWIAVTRTNVLLKDLECADCGVQGRVINTGQDVSDG